MPVSRADESVLGRWWWSVDRVTLGAIGLLFAFGFVLALAAASSAAHRLGARDHMMLGKQIVFLALGGAVLLGISLLSPREIRRLALIGGAVALALTAATLVSGVEVLGARRWVRIAGVPIQPSEFLKPCFTVVTAWLLAEQRRVRGFPGAWIVGALYLVIVLLLKKQPDVGMTAVITAVLFAQLFVYGINAVWVGIGMLAMTALAAGAYFMFSHVQMRVAEFLHAKGPQNYQIHTALQAFGNGGLFGRGPGEGRVKNLLPDAYADFIFAVAGEEYGLIVCAALVLAFAFVVIRGLLRLLRETDTFISLACAGLLASFGLQAFVNMGTALKLIPTKGMTLPFISYGGSSVLASALEVGMLLALSRRRGGGEAAS
ncbi:MAG: cell division protein FtsW [Rhodospirillales bacterium]|nr:cell division protein FtsW [Rhodospirillales bacterium]